MSWVLILGSYKSRCTALEWHNFYTIFCDSQSSVLKIEIFTHTRAPVVVISEARLIFLFGKEVKSRTAVVWGATLRRWGSTSRRFRGTYRIFLQGYMKNL